MPTVPQKKKKTNDTESKIDDAIARIDAALPVIHKRIEAARLQDPASPPTASAVSPSNGTNGTMSFARMQRALTDLSQEISESSEEFWSPEEVKQERARLESSRSERKA